MITRRDAATELLRRRSARTNLYDYVRYTTPGYVESLFAKTVCKALDKFIEDVLNGVRPILILEAPPQHGKSEIVSRKLPAYLLSRFGEWRIAAASYSTSLADSMSLDVRRNIADKSHRTLFPVADEIKKYTVNRNGEFTSPYDVRGIYISDGIGGGFTGRPATIFIIDDPVKNAQKALSPTTKESHWNWFQSTGKTRMQKT